MSFSFPLYVLLLPLGAIAVVAAAVGLLNLRLLAKFSGRDAVTMAVMLLYAAGVVVILGGALAATAAADWTAPVVFSPIAEANAPRL